MIRFPWLFRLLNCCFIYINLYRKLQPGRTVGRGVLYSVSHCGRCEKVHHFLTHTASPGFFSVFTLSLFSSCSSHVFLNFFLHFFPSILSPLVPPTPISCFCPDPWKYFKKSYLYFAVSFSFPLLSPSSVFLLLSYFYAFFLFPFSLFFQLYIISKSFYFKFFTMFFYSIAHYSYLSLSLSLSFYLFSLLFFISQTCTQTNITFWACD